MGEPTPLFGEDHGFADDRFAFEAKRMFELAAETDDEEVAMQAGHLLSQLLDWDRDSDRFARVHEALATSEDFRHRAIGAATLNAALPYRRTHVAARWSELLADENQRVWVLAGSEFEVANRRRSLDIPDMRRIINEAVRIAHHRDPERADAGTERIIDHLIELEYLYEDPERPERRYEDPTQFEDPDPGISGSD